MATFFDMGGYGLFIWPCFVISAIVLLALYFLSRQRLKRVERELSVMESRRGERRREGGISEPAGETMS
ncbi:heme exporter protein CcmD [Sneathiella chungangensis]|uniref:Heme exporter protein D n=1 Tax=Sneathiella chungangensis TaxID=1418234 RepID=A0A845MIF1_9PROT|nr:heme exporter protein CcmD [Sneathiella chungangensis]MZR23738.1 heme exporter protein CcmD [Sneathiella chungangensis]